MVLNPLQTIFSAMMSVLEPLINNLLSPLVGILQIIGQTLGHILAPLLQALGPIIEFIGKAFVWLYNKIIRPVGNGIITLFNIVYNAVVTVANGFIWVYNLLRRKSKHKDYIETRGLREGHLGEISYADVTAAGEAAVGATTTGAGASYTAGRTMNIQININTDVLTGDGGFRQLAIMLRDEIRSLEALGA